MCYAPLRDQGALDADSARRLATVAAARQAAPPRALHARLRARGLPLMPRALYMDPHVARGIPVGSRTRPVGVRTAQEDGTSRLRDRARLDRAAARGRVLFSRDAAVPAAAPARGSRSAPASMIAPASRGRTNPLMRPSRTAPPLRMLRARQGIMVPLHHARLARSAYNGGTSPGDGAHQRTV